MTNFRNEFARRWRSFALLSVMLLGVSALAAGCVSSGDLDAISSDLTEARTTIEAISSDLSAIEGRLATLEGAAGQPSTSPAEPEEPEAVVCELSDLVGTYPETVYRTSSVTSSGTRGDHTLNIAIPESVTGSNIWAWLGTDASTYNAAVYLNRYPALMGYSDRRYDWIPDIGDGFPSEVVEDGDCYSVTARIQPDLTWPDGSPLNAHDLAFVANTVVDLELVGNWTGIFQPDFFNRAQVLDDLTVKYYFHAKPGLAVWQFGAAFAPILPNEYWEPLVENLLAEHDDPSTPAVEQAVREQLFSIDASDEPTLGPVTIGRVEQDAFVSLNRNDDYYLADSVVRQYDDGTHVEIVNGREGVFYGDAGGEIELEFSRVQQQATSIFTTFQNQDAAILALRSGDTDYFLSPLGLSPGLRAQVENAEGVEIFENPSNGYRYLGFNARREPFSDVAFRQAVATLIDLELIANDVLQGAVLPIYSVVPEGNGFWYNPDTPRYGFNTVDGELVPMTREERINEAVRILTDAGYSWSTEPSWDSDNMRVIAGEGLAGPDGQEIEEFEIISVTQAYDPLRFSAATFAQRWMNEAGIPAVAVPTDFNEIVDRVFTEQDFDMWVLGWGLTPYPDHLVTFHTEANAGADGFNPGGWVNDEFEALSARFLAETDINAARDLVFQLQDIIARELPVITLFATPIVEAYRPDAFGFAYTDVLDGVQNLFQGSSGPLANSVFE